MKEIDFSVFESHFWKPDDDKDYLVELGNPRVSEKIFGEGNEKDKRTVLVHDVYKVNAEVFTTPKEFSTGSRSFIDLIKPIIQKAQREGKERYTVVLKRKNGKEYTVMDYSNIQGIAGTTA